MQAKSLTVSIQRNGAFVNGTAVGKAAPPSEFYAVFGTPDRILDGSPTPAPVGHRNNQFHYFDAYGVTLNEHHYTHQIQAINFVFDTELADHPTIHGFQGTMMLGGMQVSAGMPECRLELSDVGLVARLPGTWFAQIRSLAVDEPITVAVSTQGQKLKSGRRSKNRVITSVSLCLQHDAWDTAYIPDASDGTMP